MTRRQYPVGIQTFSRLILDGYVYVDKTDLIWELAHYATFIFLSRPRRFGKSLLTSTLESYFLGDKELFEGLKVMDLEEEWEQYPVLRLDLSIAKGQPNAAERRSTLMWLLRPLSDIYGKKEDETSLLTAFKLGKMGNYWFDTGTPTYLIRQLKLFNADITAMDNLEVPASAFDLPTENMHDALPLLYQSGYLTIKDFEPESGIYTLSMPNQEVRSGYAEGLLPAYTGLMAKDVQTGFALKFWRALKKDDIDLALREMQAYLSSLPYVEGFKKKLEDVATAEGFYEYTLYLIFSMLNVYVRTQVKCVQRRTDIVVFMPTAIYVMELKVNGTAQEALDQINSKRYAVPYQTDGRRIIKMGIRFSTETRPIDDWTIDQLDNQ